MKLAKIGDINPNKAYVKYLKDTPQLVLLYKYDKCTFHEEYYKNNEMSYCKIDQSAFMFTINYSLKCDTSNSIWYEFNTIKEAMGYIDTKRMMEELTS